MISVGRRLLLLFVFSLSLGAQAAPEFVIVSDIDDTIQKTQVHWRLNPVGFLQNLFRFHDAFVGMPPLYNALAAEGIPFHYVTATPRPLGALAQRFLETSGFPRGTLWTRDGVFQSTLEFKTARIAEIMRSYPDSKFILIGDNGQHDVEAYDRLAKHPELGSRVAATYIHQIYDFEVGKPLAEGQRPYISTAEITLDLRADGLLPEKTAQVILEHVERGLESRFRNVESLTIAEYATYDKRSIEALVARTQREQNPEIRRLILSIADSMNARLPLGAPRAEIPLSPIKPSSPAPMCAKILLP